MLTQENQEGTFELRVNGDIYAKNVIQLNTTKHLSNPLTSSNLSITDTDISKARLIVVCYTNDYKGNNYRSSMVINAGEAEWFVVESTNGNGYIMVTNDTIRTSPYSHSNFAILNYTLIM